MNEANRKFADYENKIIVLSKEIERLNEILERFSRENSDFKKKLAESEQLRQAIITLEEKFSRSSQ